MSDYSNETKKIIFSIFIGTLLLMFLIGGVRSIKEGYIGIQYRFGKIVNDDLGAGLHFKIPFIDNIKSIDVRNQIYEVTADAYTSDTQTVNELRLKVNYYYNQNELSEIIKDVGVDNVEAMLLVPNVAKIAKNEIGKVKAEVLVQSRAEVQMSIQQALYDALLPYGIIVAEFAIENLSFDTAFESAIQAKVIAEQEVLTTQSKTRQLAEENKQKIAAAETEATSMVKKAEAQASSKEITAKAEAASIKLIQEQLASNPNYNDYLKVTAWDGKLPQVASGADPFVILNPNN